MVHRVVFVAFDIGNFAFLHVYIDAATTGAHVAGGFTDFVANFRGRVHDWLIKSHNSSSGSVLDVQRGAAVHGSFVGGGYDCGKGSGCHARGRWIGTRGQQDGNGRPHHDARSTPAGHVNGRFENGVS